MLSYKIEKCETFLVFSSRVYRHLKLCSRLKPPAERENYVESHRCSILKNSLSPDILSAITRKEQIFRAFSSQEILDHVISSYHVKSLADETEQYQVFYASKENTPIASQIRSLEQREVKRKTKS